MSSKWGRYPTPRLRPAICKSFAGSCLPVYPMEHPPALWAYVVWYDLDPLDPIAGAGFVRLLHIRDPWHYYGISARSSIQVAARIRPSEHTYFWFINTILHYYNHEPANYTWGEHFVDPREPFDTGLLEHIHLPGLDFKKVRITT